MAGSGLLLENGRVYVTADPADRTDAVLVERGLVTALGADARRLARGDVRRIDLDGRVALPGFNDAHTHIMSVGLVELETDLSGAPDRSSALDRLAANASDTPAGDWVIGFGYDESMWPTDERRYLTMAELDEVSTEHPVAAQRVDGHTMTLNARAFEQVDLAGVEDDVAIGPDGEPTGVITEEAVGRLRRHLWPSGRKGREALAAAVTKATELGLTSVQTMSGLTVQSGSGSDRLRTFFDAWRADKLPIRLTAWVHPKHLECMRDLELAGGFGDDRFRLGGLKRFADGSIGARTAKLDGEFADDPGNDGELVMTPQRLSESATTAASFGLPIATHAIGSAAIELVLDNYEEVHEEYERYDPLLRIEHVELASDAALERMADMGVVASMQPNFLQWSSPGGLYESRLGEGRLGGDNRFRDVVAAGVPLAFGSDKMPFGPLYGIHHAVNAPFSSQEVSVETAVEAYTVGAAMAEGTADRKGTLEPGMLGDVVVLDRDPYDRPEEIIDTNIGMTIVDGKVVYERDTRS